MKCEKCGKEIKTAYTLYHKPSFFEEVTMDVCLRCIENFANLPTGERTAWTQSTYLSNVRDAKGQPTKTIPAVGTLHTNLCA